MGVIMKNKVNYTGGGGGGSSTLADLEDVELTTPTDGQALVYDAENDLWINGGVVGSGGGSAKYSETVLWEDANGLEFHTGSQQTVLLNDSIRNYTFLCFITSTIADPSYRNQSLIPVSTILSSPMNYFNSVNIGGSDYNVPAIEYVDDTHVKFVGWSSSYHLKAYKVIGIKWETMQTALVYSEEEREVGVWIDGKPLYQKTIDGGLLYNDSNEHQIAHNVLNLDHVVDIRTILIGVSNNAEVPAPNYRTSSQTGITVNRSGDYLQYRNNWQDANAFKIWFTIQYTKTTDTAGSGIWTTTGEYAVHYDGNEKVIGTWFGETLYEKSYHLANASNTTYILEQTFQATLVDSTGSWTDSSGYRRPIPYEYVNLDVFVYSYNNQLKLQFAPSNATDVYITIRYTKSS